MEVLRIDIDKISEHTYLSRMVVLIGEHKFELKPNTKQSQMILESLKPFVQEALFAIKEDANAV